VAKISLVDGRTGDSHAVNPLDGLLAGRRRFEVGEVTVYDNAEAMPRAWLVPEVISAPAPRILQTIRTSVLPDGGRFDPRRVALVEGRFSLEPDGPDPDAAADVVRLSNTGIEIRTRTRRAQFLVMGDIYYPGWRASIDGVEVPIHRTNYALRGVLVPPGEHSVRLDFRPLSFYLGGVLTGLAAVTVAAVVVRDRRRRRAAAVSGSTAGASTGSPSP
jgi:hypothetical protein